MKLTSRRSARSTAQESVDEGMGGGDYPTVVHEPTVVSDLSVEPAPQAGSEPTVVSDLSVEPAPQGFPNQVYPDLAPEQERPAYGAGDDFWGTVGSESEKASRRRFRRGGRSLGVVDYPSVDEAPVVIPDLSVHHDLQIIPDPAGHGETVTEEPPSDGGNDFWTSISAEPEKAPRPWWRRKTTWITATILFTVTAVALSLIAISGPAVKNKRTSFTFPVEAFPQTGVTVSRIWTLYGGSHPTLHGDLTFYSSRSDQVSVEELLPTSLVTNPSQVTFVPQAQIVSKDPLVASYSISSAISGVTSVAYNVQLPTGTKYDLTSLRRWAADQSAQQGQRYLQSHTLASIHLTPPSIVVKKGGASYQLAISGLLRDKSAAPTIAFGTAKWSVANPKIAKVSDKGAVTGLNVGRTTVRAQIGKLSATATVTVSAAANVKTTPALKPLKPGPLSTVPGTVQSSIGPISDPTQAPVVNPPTKPVVHNPPPVVHTPPPPPPPPAVCPTPPPGPSNVASNSYAVGELTVTWADPSTAGCSLQGESVFVTDSAGHQASQVIGPLVGAATFSGLASGTASVSVTASYGTQNSAPVGGSGSVQGPPPPPPPTCTTAQEHGPSNPAAVASDPANPDNFTISWTAGSVDAGTSCAITSEAALIDGTTSVTNGGVVPLTPGTHQLVVTTTFGDGTTQSASLGITAP